MIYEQNKMWTLTLRKSSFNKSKNQDHALGSSQGKPSYVKVKFSVFMSMCEDDKTESSFQ